MSKHEIYAWWSKGRCRMEEGMPEAAARGSVSHFQSTCASKEATNKVVEEARLERQTQEECHEQVEINTIRREQVCKE